MRIYLVVFLLTVFLSLVIPSKTDHQWRWKLFWTLIPLFLFGALRVDFGNDYWAYEDSFMSFHSQPKFAFDADAHEEYGYQLLCYILPSYRSLLILNAALLCISIGVFFYNCVPKQFLWLAFVLVFLNPDKIVYAWLVGLRSGIAASGFVLGSCLIRRRKLLLSVFLALLLSSFHLSAIIFISLAYIIGLDVRITKGEFILWVITVVVLLSLSVSGIADTLFSLFSFGFERYDYYFDDFITHRGWLLTVASFILMLLFFVLFINEGQTLTKEQNSLCRLGLLSISCAFLGSISVRSGFFYYPFLIGAMLVLFERERTKKYAFASWGALVLVIAMSLFSFRLWYLNNATNPLYSIYHSLIGSW